MENSRYIRYFEDMLNILKFYDLTVSEFKEYYLRLSYAIEHNYIKNPLRYIYALLNTRVEPILTRTDEEIFSFVKTGLSALMFQSLKNPNNSKILDDYYKKEFAKMGQIFSLKNIYFDTFANYYSLINMALDIPTKSINLKKIIIFTKALLDIKVIILMSIERERFDKMKAKLKEKYRSLLNEELNKPKRI